MIVEVPEKYGGMSLSQIYKQLEKEGKYFPSAALAQDLGVGFEQPLQAGQKFTFKDDPGSGGYQFLQQQFAPAGTYQSAQSTQSTQQQQAFVDDQRARESEFLGRVQGIPASLRALEEELGIPQARNVYQAAGQDVLNVSNQLRDIAPAQLALSKQIGISAPRLQQRIAAETAKLQPAAETKTRALESAQLGLSGLLGAYETRTQNILAPYAIEAGVLGDSIKNEFDLYKTNIQASLSRELAELSSKTQLTIADMDRATRLAEIENATINGEFRDLGDRVVLVNPQTGEEIQSFSKGLEPTRSNNIVNDPYKYTSPSYTPSSGAGTVSGNWYFDGQNWIPIY
jgi:hypothetical protein